ncbi:MAG: recombination protein RmuC [Pseudomonadota bacterium]|jgi:DNA recombination protein RmuC
MILEVLTPVLLGLLLVVVLLLWQRMGRERGDLEALQRLGEGLAELKGQVTSLAQTQATAQSALRSELAQRIQALEESQRRSLEALQRQAQASTAQLNNTALATQKTVADSLAALREKLEQALRGELQQIRADNQTQLEAMRTTVDEKLQGTLEQRLGESFKLVSDRLEQVHRGLGEMQTLASGVGDLKRVLTNVKTRGTWGEMQLENLLQQLLTVEQYERNVATVPGSSARVEFAVRMPGPQSGTGRLLLPIDAKFPVEDYQRLLDAQDAADAGRADEAGKALEQRLRSEARSIRDKYLAPPHTTDFAVLYLSTEGLYAEALRRPGLAEWVQNECRVILCGPTTLAALLNSLQMGFRTLAIEKRSSEVWQVLGAVKSEFGKFGEALAKTRKKLEEASNTIDAADRRNRVLTRTLGKVEALPALEAQAVLGVGGERPVEDDDED